MHANYDDIRSRINEPPIWFDEVAVPRYVEFAPAHLSNIYAKEAALVLIACQACGTRFKVAFSRSTMDDVYDRMANRSSQRLAEAIRAGTIHYGDPPNIGCCPAGPTMNCDDLRVIEFWHRPDLEWVRDGSLEMAIEESPE